MVKTAPDYPLGTIGAVPMTAYENEELHEKKHFVLGISFLMYMKKKNDAVRRTYVGPNPVLGEDWRRV